MTAVSTADDDDDAPILEFEQWADLSARLLGAKGSERSRLLAEAKIERAAFDDAGRFYSALLSDDIDRRDLTRANVYGAKCAAAIALRRQSDPRSVERASSTAAKAPQQRRQAAPSSAGGPSPAGGPLPAGAPGSGPRPTRVAEPGDAGAALPFQAGSATPPVRDVAPRVISGTLDGPPMGSSPALPFAASETGMSIEDYAGFRAELAAHPEREADIAKRFGVEAPDARRALDEAFRIRFAKDREAHRRFLALSTAQVARFVSAKGK
jgi:hypothetical protein